MAAQLDTLVTDDGRDQAVALFDEHGHCEYMTPAARRLIEQLGQIGTRVDALSSYVARHDPSLRLTIVRLNATHELRGARYLAVFERCNRIEQHLTGRQLEVARFAAAGATVDEIASTLSISPNTVKSHLKRVYEQLGIGSRVELVTALDAV